jgi:hypothetical protein
MALSELFESLPAPTIHDQCSDEAGELIQCVLTSGVDGFRTNLFTYQKETIASMIQQELHPGSDTDPLYLPLQSILDQSTFYFNPITLDVSQRPPLTAQCHGGILCEDMGTGKTCMLLGRIQTLAQSSGD